MVSTQKIRINNLAKDLNMKSKDLLEALTKSGVAGKTSTGTLDPVEFSLLFDSLTTDNQIKNMGDYLSGKADIDRPKETIKEEKPAEKATAAEKKPEEPKSQAEQKTPQSQTTQQKPQGTQSAQPAKQGRGQVVNSDDDVSLDDVDLFDDSTVSRTEERPQNVKTSGKMMGSHKQPQTTQNDSDIDYMSLNDISIFDSEE